MTGMFGKNEDDPFFIRNREERDLLSPRELDIVKLIAGPETLEAKKIGERLNMSEWSVKSMLKRVHRKTGVVNRAGLVRWAIKHGHVTV